MTYAIGLISQGSAPLYPGLCCIERRAPLFTPYALGSAAFTADCRLPLGFLVRVMKFVFGRQGNGHAEEGLLEFQRFHGAMPYSLGNNDRRRFREDVVFFLPLGPYLKVDFGSEITDIPRIGAYEINDFIVIMDVRLGGHSQLARSQSKSVDDVAGKSIKDIRTG